MTQQEAIRFVTAWSKSSSVLSVVEALRRPITSVLNLARYLRRKGVRLPVHPDEFPRSTKNIFQEKTGMVGNRLHHEARVKNVDIVHSKFPSWFEPKFEVEEAIGGGWVGIAQVDQLVKMIPLRNPKGRNNFHDLRSDLKGLMKSIKLVGLNQFPTVSDLELIDGVRRVTVLKEEGVPTVPVLYKPGATSATFAEIQSQSKAHTPVQKVETWLKDPSGVTYRWQRLCKEAVDDVGRGLVKRVTANRKNVLSMLEFARRAFHYCQPSSVTRKEFLQRAVRCQLVNGDQESLKVWLRDRKSPVLLCERILAESSLRHC